MLNGKRIKAISFDVTGTLIVHRDPVMETYANAAAWAKLPDPPTAAELKPAFKQAYKETLMDSPCFRNHPRLYSSRNWWLQTVKRAVELTGRTGYSDQVKGCVVESAASSSEALISDIRSSIVSLGESTRYLPQSLPSPSIP